MYFHRTVRDRPATVWRRCDVVVDRWRCRPDVEGGPLIRSNLYLKKVLNTKLIWPKNLLSALLANWVEYGIYDENLVTCPHRPNDMKTIFMK